MGRRSRAAVVAQVGDAHHEAVERRALPGALAGIGALHVPGHGRLRGVHRDHAAHAALVDVHGEGLQGAEGPLGVPRVAGAAVGVRQDQGHPRLRHPRRARAHRRRVVGDVVVLPGQEAAVAGAPLDRHVQQGVGEVLGRHVVVQVAPAPGGGHRVDREPLAGAVGEQDAVLVAQEGRLGRGSPPGEPPRVVPQGPGHRVAAALGLRRRPGAHVQTPHLEHPADVGPLGGPGRGASERLDKGAVGGVGARHAGPGGDGHAARRVGRRRQDPRGELDRRGRRLGGRRRPGRRVRLGRRLGRRRPGRWRLGSGRRARRWRRRGRQGLRGRGGRGRLDHRHDRRLVGTGEPGRSAEAHRGRDGAHRQQAGALAGAAHDACRARLTALS